MWCDREISLALRQHSQKSFRLHLTEAGLIYKVTETCKIQCHKNIFFKISDGQAQFTFTAFAVFSGVEAETPDFSSKTYITLNKMQLFSVCFLHLWPWEIPTNTAVANFWEQTNTFYCFGYKKFSIWIVWYQYWILGSLLCFFFCEH